MSDSQIDEAILSAAGERWTKVAMVIARGSRANSNLPANDGAFQLISDHIERLVDEGRLSVQGNIKNWRFSEIRATPGLKP